jgi:hypothetical protein
VFAFYGFADMKTLLRTPVVTFWMLHRNVDRITAERDMRTASLAVQTQSSEGIKALMGDLKKQMGVVVDFDRVILGQVEVLDRKGLQALKALGKAFG